MNLPIGLTLTRIVAVPLLIVFLISSSRVHALIAAAIFILAAITDWADGMLARRRNQVTTLGTLLDPIADKLLVAAALVSLLAIDKIDAWIVVVIVGRELAVTGLRAVAATRNPGGSNPFSMINMVIATYWLTVFHLAIRDAGTITPTDAATARRPVTASSRPTMTTTIHASILSMASSDTSAAATRSLSAIGSRSVPRVVTWLRRRA